MEWIIGTVLMIVVVAMAVYDYRAEYGDSEYAAMVGRPAVRADHHRLQSDVLQHLRSEYDTAYRTAKLYRDDQPAATRLQSIVDLIIETRKANDSGTYHIPEFTSDRVLQALYRSS